MIVMGEQETVEARDVRAEVATAEREAAVRRLGGLRRALADVGTFSEAALRMPLRPYQLDVARAVARSVAERQGLTFTVMMVPRGHAHRWGAHQGA